jgi:CheY-like chemotaxis protein
VTKQFSKLSTDSAQQLAQLDEASEGTLNELLERIESEKVNLPIEDHPIIGWGISVARARIVEQEEYRKKMLSALENRYNNGYEYFIEIAQWRLITVQKKWLDECRCQDLVPIVLATAKAEQTDKAGEFASKLRDYIWLYCQEPQAVVTFNGSIGYCVSILEGMKGKSHEPDLKPYIDNAIEDLKNS